MHKYLPVKCLFCTIFLVVLLPIVAKAQLLQNGYASYYGKRFHGRKTANGERFNMHELTAAHRTLPFGTIVKVTRVDNGQFVYVRINDRGPFVRGRIIDLSLAAAKILKMIRHGKKKVNIELINEDLTVEELMAGVQKVDSIFLINNRPKKRQIKSILKANNRLRAKPHLVVKVPTKRQYNVKVEGDGNWLKTIIQKMFPQ